jgi:isopentenyl-diphosphate delta-isomerase
MEKVVLVDEQDLPVGTEEKLKAHRDGGVLHRAISVFIFNSSGELLLQRRALEKYHAPGLWSNACCTHPKPGEKPGEAAHRRLQEELGFDCPLKKVAEVTYRADVGGGLTEHEFDHVFFGRFDGDPDPDPREVSGTRWVSLGELKESMKKRPGGYTPWFRILLGRLAGELERF